MVRVENTCWETYQEYTKVNLTPYGNIPRLFGIGSFARMHGTLIKDNGGFNIPNDILSDDAGFIALRVSCIARLAGVEQEISARGGGIRKEDLVDLVNGPVGGTQVFGFGPRDFEETFDKTIEEMKTIGVVELKIIVKREDNGEILGEEQDFKPWYIGHTDLENPEHVPLLCKIEGPSEATIEWGGSVTLNFNWDWGPVFNTPAGDGAYFSQLGLAYASYYPEYEYAQGGVPQNQGVFAVLLPSENVTSGIIDFMNQFGNESSPFYFINDTLAYEILEGGTLSEQPGFDFEDIENNLKSPYHGTISLQEPTYEQGTYHSDVWQSIYDITEGLAQGQIDMPAEIITQVSAGIWQFMQYFWAPVHDSAGNIVDYEPTSGLFLGDNYTLDTEIFMGQEYLSPATLEWDMGFSMTYQHNGESGGGSIDKFYLLLKSQEGYAIKTIDIQLPLNPGYWEELLIPSDDDIWENIPYIEYDPHNSITIQKPCDIIWHLLEIELNYTGEVNLEEIEYARSVHQLYDGNMYKMAFSVKEEIKGFDLIAKIAAESYLVPTLANNKLGMKVLKPTYTGEENNIVPIKHSDIIKFDISREPTDKIITRIKSYYNHDEVTDSFLDEVPSIKVSQDILPAYKAEYYNLDKVEQENGLVTIDHRKYNLELDLEMIKDTQTALEFTVFKLFDRCQPHNIVNLKLPLKFMYLEVGDIIEFPEGCYNDEYIFGEDYSELRIRNGQYILPIFYIYDIAFSETIDIKARQIHHCYPAPVIWRGEIFYVPDGTEPPWWIPDTPIDEETNTDDGTGIDDDNDTPGDGDDDGGDDGEGDDTGGGTGPDTDHLGGYGFGDINNDGNIDVLDVVALVGFIIDTQELSDQAQFLADVNFDNAVNVQDAVIIVGYILES